MVYGNVLDVGVASTVADASVTKAKMNLISDSSSAGLTVKGDGSSENGTLQLNCSQNSHGVKISSPAHSAGQSYELILPTGNVTADKFLKVASVSGSGATGIGQLSFASAGGILQVKRMSTHTTSSHTSMSDTAVTLSITPSSTSHKILGFATTHIGVDSDIYALTRVRNSTSGVTVSGSQRYSPRSGANMINHGMHMFLDSPSSISSQTYVLQASNTGSGNVYFNTRDNDSNTGVAEMVLMEVAV
jgi:hypothetical protein